VHLGPSPEAYRRTLAGTRISVQEVESTDVVCDDLYLDAGSEVALRDCGDIHRPGKTWHSQPTDRQELALNARRDTPEEGITR
jgi:hypothetical protein